MESFRCKSRTLHRNTISIDALARSNLKRISRYLISKETKQGILARQSAYIASSKATKHVSVVLDLYTRVPTSVSGNWTLTSPTSIIDGDVSEIIGSCRSTIESSSLTGGFNA